MFIATGNVTDINLSVNENTITGAWNPPQCKGNIKEMKVQYRRRGKSKWGTGLITATNTDKELTIKCLDNGVEYEVRVIVVDINGREHMTQASGTAKIGKCSITIINVVFLKGSIKATIVAGRTIPYKRHFYSKGNKTYATT